MFMGMIPLEDIKKIVEEKCLQLDIECFFVKAIMKEKL